MQQENMRLVKVVAERTPAAEREVLADLISSNERLIAEKQKASPPLPVHTPAHPLNVPLLLCIWSAAQ